MEAVKPRVRVWMLTPGLRRRTPTVMIPMQPGIYKSIQNPLTVIYYLNDKEIMNLLFKLMIKTTFTYNICKEVVFITKQNLRIMERNEVEGSSYLRSSFCSIFSSCEGL